MPCRGEATNNKVVKTGEKRWPRSSSLTCFPSAGAICIFKNIHFHLRADSRCQIRQLWVGFENHFRRWRSHVTRPTLAPAAVQVPKTRLSRRRASPPPSQQVIVQLNRPLFHPKMDAAVLGVLWWMHSTWWCVQVLVRDVVESPFLLEKHPIYVPEDEQTMSNHSPQPDSTGLSDPDCIYVSYLVIFNQK